MKILNKISIIFLAFIMTSCADYKINNKTSKIEKKLFSSSGFALIYDESLYNDGVINKKIKKDGIVVFHSFLKKNTPIKIINPLNSKVISTKISNKANYPSIFVIIISKQTADTLNLDLENPYIEVFEVKKNKTFVAKEGNIFEEERNVAEKAPVDEIKMDNITEIEKTSDPQKIKKEKFVIIISDFYYKDSASNLKKELSKKISVNSISIKKINNTKYRLLAGPFENFNALKTTYISLNNLGFEDLNIYNE